MRLLILKFAVTGTNKKRLCNTANKSRVKSLVTANGAEPGFLGASLLTLQINYSLLTKNIIIFYQELVNLHGAAKKPFDTKGYPESKQA